MQNATKCVIADHFVMIPRSRKIVLNLSPSIPVNAKEEFSCYATLLLHVPWDIEANIEAPFDNAVEKLQHAVMHDLIPSYLHELQSQKAESERILRNQGQCFNILFFSSSSKDVDLICIFLYL